MVLVMIASAALAAGAADSSVQTVTPTAQTISVDSPQRPAPFELSPAEATELERWMRDFDEWKKWWAEWANRPEPGLFTSSRPRREKPQPPDWLSARCAALVIDADPLRRACALVAEWRQDNAALLSRQVRAAVAQMKEDGTKTIWWEHIHVDVLWPATQVRTDVYGVIGAHTSMTVRGRLQVFLAPGVMLLNLPAMDGTRVWKVATNYGIGYRLFDFTFPGDRRASLHLNLAKSWLVSDTCDLLVARNLDFVGLSMTFKRR